MKINNANTSQIVKEHLENNAFILDYLSRDLINVASLAREILPYIKEQNKKGKKLFGGIVANTDSRNYKGRWVYFTENSENFKKGEFKNWIDLQL